MRLGSKYVAIGAAGVALCVAAGGVVVARHRDTAAASAVTSLAPGASATPEPTAAPATSTAPPPRTSSITSPEVTPSRSARAASRKPSTKPATARPAGSSTCTKPVFTTSDQNGGWSTHGYYVHNNMWNASEGGPETLYACSYDNWYVTSTQPDTTSVKTYPNVHKDYDNVPISSFNSLTSRFGASSPHVGIYNVAYDIWINGIAENGSTELMIWTENYRQRPAGDKVTRVTLGGRTYDVWTADDSHYIAFVPTKVVTAGSVDLLQIFHWVMDKGWLGRDATLGQVDYGVEICSTRNKPATFRFTDFSISES